MASNSKLSDAQLAQRKTDANQKLDTIIGPDPFLRGFVLNITRWDDQASSTGVAGDVANSDIGPRRQAEATGTAKRKSIDNSRSSGSLVPKKMRYGDDEGDEMLASPVDLTQKGPVDYEKYRELKDRVKQFAARNKELSNDNDNLKEAQQADARLLAESREKVAELQTNLDTARKLVRRLTKYKRERKDLRLIVRQWSGALDRISLSSTDSEDSEWQGIESESGADDGPVQDQAQLEPRTERASSSPTPELE
ncbi:hypothetical protein Daus18300_013336 [Diaporthe australafricana]|uniref:Uncharacterized protein n=1 Tax=Diaporthe australafricana TaxID=127596 RepID=A0ABR3VZG9_9PEZI